jgi:hypothetical protein
MDLEALEASALMSDYSTFDMAGRIQGLTVKNVQCDELWGFVGMKEKTKSRKGIETGKMGDAYCFVAMKRTNTGTLAVELQPIRWILQRN